MPGTDPTRQPVIIEAALNGQTQKDANPHVPHSSEEIARDALRCLEAGAAIVHTHIQRHPGGSRSRLVIRLRACRA